MPEPLGRPVQAPRPRTGDDAFVTAAQNRAALNEANNRLQLTREFYEDVQERWNKKP